MTLPLTHAPTSPTFGPSDDVALAAAGDRAAFERLYRSHVNRVFSVCLRMVSNRDTAEELTQDVFVRCWEKLGTFRGDSQFSTWLHRLAVNVVLNEREAEGRRRKRHDDGVEDLEPGVDVLDVLVDVHAELAPWPHRRVQRLAQFLPHRLVLLPQSFDLGLQGDVLGEELVLGVLLHR